MLIFEGGEGPLESFLLGGEVGEREGARGGEGRKGGSDAGQRGFVRGCGEVEDGLLD